MKPFSLALVFMFVFAMKWSRDFKTFCLIAGGVLVVFLIARMRNP